MTINLEIDLQLDERLTKLFKTVESSPVMIMITNSAGIIEKVNRKLCQFTGYNPEELVGDSILLLGEIDATTAQEMQRKLDSGSEWTGKLRSLKKNGDDFWEDVSIFPIQDSEGIGEQQIGNRPTGRQAGGPLPAFPGQTGGQERG